MRPFFLSTPRLRLREMSLEDIDFVAGMLADREVMRYYPKVYSRREAQQWIERQVTRYREDGHGLWLVLDGANGTPIGQVGLLMQDVNSMRLPEIGYLIHRPYWGRGYATEAASAVRDHAFSEWKYPKIVSLIRPENVPSQRVAQNLGMKTEGDTLHHDLLHHVWSCSREIVTTLPSLPSSGEFSTPETSDLP